MDKLNFAAIDIGSNAVRLLIKGIVAGETEQDLRKVFIVRVPLRLGQDVFTKGRVSNEKTEKLLRLIGAFNQLMQVYNVISYRACATSAMRDASNGAEIVRYISEMTGICIEIIDGKEEARIVYDNHSVDILDSDGNFAYVDVGGGSTEISVISNRSLIDSHSYNIGTVRILNNRVDNSELQRMYKDLSSLYRQYGNMEIIGSGGNINKLYHLSSTPEGEPLTVRSLTEVVSRLHSMPVKKRIDDLGLKPDRADVIVPAGEIYMQVASHLGVNNIWVPTIGIVDGITYTLCAGYIRDHKCEN